jgi:hypothetical protein
MNCGSGFEKHIYAWINGLIFCARQRRQHKGSLASPTFRTQGSMFALYDKDGIVCAFNTLNELNPHNFITLPYRTSLCALLDCCVFSFGLPLIFFTAVFHFFPASAPHSSPFQFPMTVSSPIIQSRCSKLGASSSTSI